MKTIVKYVFESDEQTFQMPAKAMPRKVGMQNDKVCLWVEMPKQDPTIARTFHISATDAELPDKWVYIDSFSEVYKQYCWHIWEST